jgi:Tol biopolymer transport system component
MGPHHTAARRYRLNLRVVPPARREAGSQSVLAFHPILWLDRAVMPAAPTGPDGPLLPSPAERLDSWKAIAAYLGRAVTTVQRWEQEEGLPIRRLPHAKKGSVFAYKKELEHWRAERTQALATNTPARMPDAAHPSSESTGSAPRPTAPAGSRPGVILAVGALPVIVLAVGLGWQWVSGAGAVGTRSTPPTSTTGRAVPRPLTSQGDNERAPSLSPDGRRVAFVRERNTGRGLYTKTLPDGVPELIWPFDARNPIFLTKWSPSGEQIAFNGQEGEHAYALFTIPSGGGVPVRLTSMAGIGLCWAPDGNSISFVDRTSPADPFSIYSLNLETRTRTRTTAPAGGTFGDTACAWSPDARRLAVARFLTRYESDVLLLTPGTKTPPVALTSGLGGIAGLDWTSDGQAVVFGSHTGLWKVAADGLSQPVKVLENSGSVAHPAFSRTGVARGDSLTYAARAARIETWLWRAAEGTSMRWETGEPFWIELPAFSRSGQYVAFVRGREVWVASADGSGARKVTSHAADPERIVTSPQWSPDDRRIAFSVPIAGQRDIYVIDADGANSYRLTTEPSIEDNPSWSRDGRWIYFRSDRSGVNRIWKSPAQGGVAVPVTAGEGAQAFESADGSTLYFVRGTWQKGLWEVPTVGGTERLLLAAVEEGMWGVGQAGVFFVESPESRPQLRLLPRNGGPVRTLAEFHASAKAGFTVAEDGQRVLWTHRGEVSTNVMLLHPWAR